MYSRLTFGTVKVKVLGDFLSLEETLTYVFEINFWCNSRLINYSYCIFIRNLARGPKL
jgi:hypothetical protein